MDIRDGKNHWLHDLAKLDKKINKLSSALNLEDFDTFYVDSVNDLKSQTIIAKLQPDIIFQAGAGILKSSIFSLPKKATINIHHGLAPEIRGMKSTFWCLYYGLTDLIGVTCHVIDETLDTGDVLSQFKYDYKSGDSFINIQEVICQKGADLLLVALDKYDRYTAFESSSEEIISYYFSDVDPLDYNALKKNSFLALKQSEVPKLKTKKKIKTIIKPKLH